MTALDQLINEWVEISELHIPADDPYAVRVCHALQCACEIEHLRDEGRLS